MKNYDIRTPVEVITDSINDLVRSRVNKEPYLHVTTDENQHVVDETPMVHKTNVPSLIDQLEALLEPGGTGESGHAHPASKPAFRTEAYDVLIGIDRGAQMWLRYCNLTTRHNLADDLRQLVGATGQMLEHAVFNMSLEIRQWATRARIATAWETPAKTPHNSCPLCGAHGTLRVRLDVGTDVGTGSGEAMCVSCEQAWDRFNIGLLSAHIIWENDNRGRETVEVTPDEVACWFCGAEPGAPCVTGLEREPVAPHSSRVAQAAQGVTLDIAS